MSRDRFYMNIALDLARKGLGKTRPNPAVGALLVKNGRILAKGYHKRAGLPHAEIEALNSAGKAAKGATLYVTLEPCGHFGKTPPCTDRIIKEEVKRVVIAMRDPNPVNCGRGVEKLRKNSISVKCGVLEKEAALLNRVFTTYITQKRPFVTIKAAQSLDGKIATPSGDSKWITNERSRRFVHRLRSRVDAVLVGVNTVIKDDPLLNSRIRGAKRQPVRIILDSRLRTPRTSRILKDRSARTIIATTPAAAKRAGRFEDMGVEVGVFRKKRDGVDLKSLLAFLAGKEISHILVEGGGSVIAGFLKEGLADEMLFFISPRVIGGRNAVTSVEGEGAKSIKESVVLKNIEIKRFGEDVLIRGDVHRNN